ncbi:MAG: SDR family oxidoreductase [Brooklawnia sp.]|uniref:NAD(P)-dependent oxidoreductase n=1 Tax=Brooklawnia sp. TaxID=2699740 RepID=UPI003C78B4A3
MTVIALFGATGKIGRRVLDRALAAGYQVRVLVRDPARLTTSHPRLTVLTGDVLDVDAVERTVVGSDVVLALFGHVKDSPKTLQTDGTRNIVAVMQAHQVPRLVTLSGGGLRAPQDRPKLPDRVIRTLLKLMAGHVLADAEGHLDVLQASGLDWTVVRGPVLTEDPGKGRYRVGWVGVDASTRISRDDLADFIISQVTDRNYVGHLPFVSD